MYSVTQNTNESSIFQTGAELTTAVTLCVKVAASCSGMFVTF